MNIIYIFLYKHYKKIILGILLSFLASISNILLLSLSGWFIAISAYTGLIGNTYNFLLPSAFIRLFSFIRLLSRYFEQLINHKTMLYLISQIRVNIYIKLETLSPGYFLKYHGGDLINMIIADVDVLDNILLGIIIPIIVLIINILCVSIFLLHINYILGIVISLLLILITCIFPTLNILLGHKIGKKLILIKSNLRCLTIDIFNGITEIILLNQEKNKLKNFIQEHKKLLMYQYKMVKIESISLGLYMITLGFILLISIILTSYLSNTCKINGSCIALVIFMILGIYECIKKLLPAFQNFYASITSINRISKIYQTESEILFVKNNNLNKINDFSLSCNNITFSYPNSKINIFDKFNLKVNHNNNIGIIAKSGYGKSTLLNLISRVIDPVSGNINIGNINIKDISEIKLRKLITVIPQYSYIFNGSVRYNLKICCPNASNIQMINALKMVELIEFSNNLNLSIGSKDRLLSGGEEKRLMLARGILHNGPIWLLDEPTANLDYITEYSIINTIKNITKNKTVIVVSHRKMTLNILTKNIILLK